MLLRLKDRKIIFCSLLLLLGIIAAVRYFLYLDAYPCFVNDEHQTYLTAYGYMKTGRFVFWDFYKDTLGTTEYTRAWPYTILLANWMKFFGTTEAACRSLSATLGVCTVCSAFYVAYRLLHSAAAAALASMLLIANSETTYHFRLTRMYALAMLLSVWTFYFWFRALDGHNFGIKKSAANGIAALGAALFDFQPVYMLLAIVSLIFLYFTHINGCVIFLGVMGYVLLVGLIFREKRYRIWSCCILALLLFIVLQVLCYNKLGTTLGVPVSVVKDLKYFASFFGHIQLKYARYIWDVGFVWLGFVLNALAIGLCFLKDSYQKTRIYLTSLSIISLFFMVFLTDRYYSPKYIIMLVPFSDMMYSMFWSYIGQETQTSHFNRLTALLGWGLTGMILCGVICTGIKSFSVLYAGASDQYADFHMAYDSVGEYYDPNIEEIPVIGLYLRDIYWSEYVSNYEYAAFDRDTDMDIFLKFAKNRKEGIITCEYAKITGLKQGARKLIEDWTDPLSGPGVDTSNVFVSHWSVLEPAGERAKSELPSAALSVEKDSDKNPIIRLGDPLVRETEAGAKLLCVKAVLTFDDGTVVEKAYQAFLEPGVDRFLLQPETKFEGKTLESVELIDSYALYKDSQLSEYSF